MSKPVVVTDNTFDQMVLQAETPVLVDFWAPWCRPCLMIAPVLDELAGEYDGRLSIVRMDIERDPKTATKYGVMSIPTLLVFKQGKPISHMVGFRPKAELKRNLDAALG